MATKTKKMNVIKQVLIGHRNGKSVRELADLHSMSPTTVQRYITLAKKDPLEINELVRLDDPELDRRFNDGRPTSFDWRYEDFTARLPYFRRELDRGGHVTVLTLWEEYRREVPDGYSLSQFRHHLRHSVMTAKPSTVLKALRKPGVEMEVDFAGDRLGYVDLETGGSVMTQTFVAILPYSGYTFATCVPSQRIDHFLGAIDAAIRFFGGVPKTLVTDNLRAAVKKPGRMPELTEGLLALASHYGIYAQPARAGKPKDKAPVEDAVRNVYTRVYAPLRNRVFHSLEELNAAVYELVESHNNRKMQGYSFSRRERFLAAEMPELQPLPPDRYETKQNFVLTVSKSGDILVGEERHRYSVPCRLIGEKVLVIATATIVRVYHKGECVAAHPRSLEESGYTYKKEHLSPNARALLERTPQYFIDKAAGYGRAAEQAMQGLFSTGNSTSWQYGQAQGILSLARAAEPEIFRKACRIAVKYGRCNYKAIKGLVQSKCRGYLAAHGQDAATGTSSPSSHANIRGPQAFQ